MSSPIEDYGLIGDGQTAALVNRNGSIDWLCWPRFDSDACFAALLGVDDNGRWSIAPKEGATRTTRRYDGDTLVLQTEMEADGGKVRLIDFMPLRDGDHSSIVRIVEGLSGAVAMEMDLRLRFDYGQMPPWVSKRPDGFEAWVGSHQVSLETEVPIEAGEHAAKAAFTVREGQRLAFVLSYAALTDVTDARGRPEQGASRDLDAEKALAETRRYWLDWIGRFDPTKTHWPDVVKRSLITLKAMVHTQTGGLVAAPTTSLPEAAAGDMNWDYRYCWLRDSAFTLSAFLNSGFHEEATAWRDWLLRAVAGSPDKMKIMYRLDGSGHLSEWTVEALAGWREARPVRIGNAAATQHQIDVYGEVIDCLSLARRAGMEITDHHVAVEKRILEHLDTVWNSRGSGVWESRGEPRRYTYSKAMAWAAFDRALADGAAPDLTSERRETLETLRRDIHDDVCRNAWNDGLGTFTQAYGNTDLDASLLLMPIVGFLPADEPRMRATIDKVAEVLSEDGLIRRQRRKADANNEGAFLACSCWMAECLELGGRHDEAVAQFERLLAVGNDLGLFAEEYDVPSRRQVGNFPQALTHLAIVNAALRLSGPVMERGGPAS